MADMNETTTPSQGAGDPGADPGPAPAPGYPPPGAGHAPPAPGYLPPGAGYPPGAGAQPPRTGTDSFFDSIRRTGLFRSDERWIGGVAGGLAVRLGIDPLIVRGLLGASVLLGGLGLVAYGLGWLLLPEQRDGRIHLQQLFRGDFDAAVLGGFALFAIGLSVPGGWSFGPWGNGSDWGDGLLWIGAIAVAAVLIVAAMNKNRAPGPGIPTDGRPTQSRPPTTAYRSGPVTTAYPASGPPAGPAQPWTTTPPPYTPAEPGRASLSGAPAGPRPPEGPRTTMYPTATYPAPVPPVTPPPPGGGQQWTPPTPSGPVTSLPRERRQGPGAGAVGIVVALSLITLASLLYAQRVGTFEGPVFLTAGAVAVVLLGVAIIVSGLRGRSSGGLGALAIIAILVLLPTASVRWDGWDGWEGEWDLGTSAGVGDVDHTPRTVEEAEAGYSLGAGDAMIDLTEIPFGDETVNVPVRVGAGDLTIVMPEDGAYTADIRVMAGEVRWLDESVSSGVGGDRGPDSYESPAVRDGQTPTIVLEVNVGAGTVRVEEER